MTIMPGDSVLITGSLIQAGMTDVLGVQGTPCHLPDGLGTGAAPLSDDGQGPIAALRVLATPALIRYADVMRLEVVRSPQGKVLGLPPQPRAVDVQAGCATSTGLAARIARLVLTAPWDLPAASVTVRLPMIVARAASQLRAARTQPQPDDLLPTPDPGAVETSSSAEVFSGYFAVERRDVRFRTHAGGLSRPVTREAFAMGDAVVVLPWDPVRDRVLLIDQFRVGPAFRGDPQAWMLEAVAGRIDAGETPAEAGRREAKEEADLTVTRMFPALHHYPSPGAVTEYLYGYVGIADLPDDAAGIHGLASEAEDIRGHLIARTDLTRRVMAG